MNRIFRDAIPMGHYHVSDIAIQQQVKLKKRKKLNCLQMFRITPTTTPSGDNKENVQMCFTSKM